MRVTLLSITPNAEELIEKAGRVSHLSHSKDEKARAEFIQRLIRSKHLSVIEHASASFLIEGISRACSHQLVRHRLASYTQRSQRYVDEKNSAYVTPPSIEENPEAKNIYLTLIGNVTQAYRKLLELGIKREDARFVLPNATETQIVMTANFREWLHFINLRTKPGAQWEIRELAEKIQQVLRRYAPNVFGISVEE